MRISFVVAVAASLLAGHALAQSNSPSNPPPSTAQAPKAEKAPAAPSTTPRAGNQATAPAAEGPQNPAIRTEEGNTATRPVAGANSFTEGEAKSRIEAKGFANVTGLMKDNQGIWRGRAQQNGRAVSVALDYQGNVFADPS